MKFYSVELQHIADANLGKMLDARKNKGILLPYLANQNVQWGYFVLENLPTMRFEKHEAQKYGVKYGDILICEGGEPGRCAIWKEEIPDMRIQKAIHRLRVKGENDFRYVYYWFLLAGRTGTLAQYYTGSTIKHIPAEKLKKIQITLPVEHAHQNGIADILSAYDELIENNRRQIKLLEEAAQRLYKEWFIDLRFPSHEHTPIIDGVPAGWEWRRLEEMADIIMGQSPESEYYNHEQQGLPFHQGVGSYGARFVEDEVYASKYSRVAEAGSILFSVRAPVGRLNVTRNRIAIGRGLAAVNHLAGFQSFMFYALKSKFFKEDIVGNGSIYASITKKQLYNQLLLCPPTGFSERFNDIVSTLDKQMDGLHQQIQLLAEARDRLLPKLMSGEIDLSHLPG